MSDTEETFEVEEIIDYRLGSVPNVSNHILYDPTLDKVINFVQYKVKWKGYPDPSEDTWEPKESFSFWLPAYDEYVREIKASNDRYEDVTVLNQRALQLNQLERARKAKSKAGKKAKKTAASGGSGNKSIKKSNSAAPSPPIYSTASKAPATGRSTTNSAVFSNFNSSEFVENNSNTKSLNSLLPDTPPRRNSKGELIGGDDEETSYFPVPVVEKVVAKSLKGLDLGKGKVKIDEDAMVVDKKEEEDDNSDEGFADEPKVVKNKSRVIPPDDDDSDEGFADEPKVVKSKGRVVAPDKEDRKLDQKPLNHSYSNTNNKSNPSAGEPMEIDDDEEEGFADGNSDDEEDEVINQLNQTSIQPTQNKQEEEDDEEEGFADGDSDEEVSAQPNQVPQQKKEDDEDDDEEEGFADGSESPPPVATKPILSQQSTSNSASKPIITSRAKSDDYHDIFGGVDGALEDDEGSDSSGFADEEPVPKKDKKKSSVTPSSLPPPPPPPPVRPSTSSTTSRLPLSHPPPPPPPVRPKAKIPTPIPATSTSTSRNIQSNKTKSKSPRIESKVMQIDEDDDEEEGFADGDSTAEEESDDSGFADEPKKVKSKPSQQQHKFPSPSPPPKKQKVKSEFEKHGSGSGMNSNSTNLSQTQFNKLQNLKIPKKSDNIASSTSNNSILPSLSSNSSINNSQSTSAWVQSVASNGGRSQSHQQQQHQPQPHHQQYPPHQRHSSQSSSTVASTSTSSHPPQSRLPPSSPNRSRLPPSIVPPPPQHPIRSRLPSTSNTVVRPLAPSSSNSTVTPVAPVLKSRLPPSNNNITGPRISNMLPPPPPPIRPPNLNKPISNPAAGNKQSPPTKDPRTHNKKVLDPFNSGVSKESFKDGYFILNASKLHQNFIQSDLGRKINLLYKNLLVDNSNESGGGGDVGFDTVFRLKTYWGLINDPYRNFFDLNKELGAGTNKAKECYIYAPGKDEKELSKKKIKDDYLGLQLILSSMNRDNLGGLQLGGKEFEIKQVEKLRNTTKAVFVHVSEIDKIGQKGGDLKELEGFRSREGMTFVIFGGEEKEKMFLQFWNPLSTLTYTPDIMKENPSKIQTILELAKASGRDFHHKDVFSWIPLNYITTFGKFWAKECDEWEKKKKSDDFPATKLIHEALSLELLNLVHPIRQTFNSRKRYFPAPGDKEEYLIPRIEELEVYLNALELNDKYVKDGEVEFLQKQVVRLRAKYLHIRRWIILATEEDVEFANEIPGVEMMTIRQVESFLALPKI